MGPGTLTVDGTFYCSGLVGGSLSVIIAGGLTVLKYNGTYTQHCAFDNATSLTIGGGAVAGIYDVLAVGQGVNITNNQGSLIISTSQGLASLYGANIPVGTLLFNEGRLSIGKAPVIWANLVNTGTVEFFEGLAFLFGSLVNSGHVTIAPSGGLTVAGGFYRQTAGVTSVESTQGLSVTAATSVGLGNFTLAGGSLSLLSPANATVDSGPYLAANLENTGGSVTVSSTGYPTFLTGNFIQGPGGITEIM